MLFIFGLLLVMIPTAPCMESFCRFNQTDPCYTALGHTLYLQMVLDARDLELLLKKESEPVIRVKNNGKKNINESIRNRSEFIINNGTLIINSVIRSDSGRYTLNVINSTGVQTHSADLQVNVTVVEVSSGVKGVIILGSVSVILILLLITAHHFYKKKKQLKPTAESVTTKDVENVETGPQKTKRKERKMKKEEEVQYGEVTFTPAVSNAQQRSKEQEDCVYSQVQRQ